MDHLVENVLFLHLTDCKQIGNQLVQSVDRTFRFYLFRLLRRRKRRVNYYV